MTHGSACQHTRRCHTPRFGNQPKPTTVSSCGTVGHGPPRAFPQSTGIPLNPPSLVTSSIQPTPLHLQLLFPVWRWGAPPTPETGTETSAKARSALASADHEAERRRQSATTQPAPMAQRATGLSVPSSIPHNPLRLATSSAHPTAASCRRMNLRRTYSSSGGGQGQSPPSTFAAASHHPLGTWWRSRWLALVVVLWLGQGCPQLLPLLPGARVAEAYAPFDLANFQNEYACNNLTTRIVRWVIVVGGSV